VSSPATSAFLSAWRKLDADRVTLCLISFSTPSAREMRYATTETLTPDGNLWQLGLSCDTVRASIAHLDPGLSPASCSIRLAKRQDASQAAGLVTGSSVLQVPYQYLLQNAVVTLWLWEDSLTDIADALQIFKGSVSRVTEVSPSGMTLNLIQDLSWNKQIPSTLVDKVSYPNSPDVSQGLPIPIVYGDHSAIGMRSPWSTAYTNKSKQEDSGAGQGVVPYVLVDAGIGAAAIKLVAAGHDCVDLLDRANGRSAFIAGENLLNPIDTGGITETLGASESYLSIADENAIAYAAVLPIDVRASENTATDPRKAMDPFDETSYATLDQAGGKTLLQLILPNAGALGRIESVQYYVAYSGDAANANNMRIRSRTPGVGFGASTDNWAAASATPAVRTGTWAAADYNAVGWGFGDNGTAVFDVRIDFTGGATNKGHIFWVALVVKYRPQRSVVTPGARLLQSRERQRIPGAGPVGAFPRFITHFVDVLPTYRLDGQFYGNIKGAKDDVGGTVTGSASALIERPPDISQHILRTYAGVSGGDIETGASADGSFVLARSTLKNAQPDDLKMACWIGERTTVQRAIQSIAEQAGLCIFMDRFTDTWLCFVWKTGAAADYDLTLSWNANDFADFQCEETSVVDSRTALRVKYGFDHYKSRTLFEAFVNASGSSQGKTQPTVRDQLLVVDGTNEDLDWKVGAATFAATLTHATYTSPIELAADMRGKMRTAEGDNSAFTGYGFSIKAGFNDKFDFQAPAGTPVQATLNAGDYTAEGAATELARAMNAVPLTGRVFSVVYDHSTNLFTVSATGGTFVIYHLGGAAGVVTSALPVFGFNLVADTAAVTTTTANYARYGDRFWYGDGDVAAAKNYLWATGASAATNAADLLGVIRADVAGGLLPLQHADYLRGNREATASDYQSRYGPREEQQINADWIRDENTAVSLRNRRFDLTARPRVVVRFSSMRCPDIRRMQVISFASDLDAVVAYPKYASDGSWSGKRFRVLEVSQNGGPAFHTEVLAIEAD
jgi:hypothetical protein